jgi:hypothetical protein
MAARAKQKLEGDTALNTIQDKPDSPSLPPQPEVAEITEDDLFGDQETKPLPQEAEIGLTVEE